MGKGKVKGRVNEGEGRGKGKGSGEAYLVHEITSCLVLRPTVCPMARSSFSLITGKFSLTLDCSLR